MNVLAERNKGALRAALGLLGAGVVVFAAGVFTLATGALETSPHNSPFPYLFFAAGGALLLAGAVMLFLVSRTPKIVAVFRGDELAFCGREYALREVECAESGARGGICGRGRLTLVFKDGTRVSALFVAEAEKAAEQINELARAAAAAAREDGGAAFKAPEQEE